MEKTEKLSKWLTNDLETWLFYTKSNVKFNPDIENSECRKVHLRFYEPDGEEDWIIKNEGFFFSLVEELDGKMSEISEIKLTPAIYPPFGFMEEEEEKQFKYKTHIRGVFVCGKLIK